MPPVRPFPVNPVLSQIAIRYTNGDFVASQILPDTQVPEEKFYFMDYSKTPTFDLVEDEVGRKGEVKEIDWECEQKEGSVTDRALKHKIPLSDIEAAQRSPIPIDPEAEATEQLIELIRLGHEVRTSRLVQNLNTYPESQRVTMGADDKFNNPEFNPIDPVKRALDKPIMRPNSLVFGQAAWTEFRSNPFIVKATLKNSGDAGMASRQAVAELFEIQNVIVGQSRLNVNRPGHAPNLAYCWGPHLSLLHINPRATVRSGVTFGYTCRLGTPWSGSEFDKNIGARGGIEVRTGESIRELIIAPQCGYFFQNCISSNL